MTEDRFEELTNLYLDGEIGRGDLRELKECLDSDPDRRAAFVERMRFEQASRKAMYSSTRERLSRAIAEYGTQPDAPRPTATLQWVLAGICVGFIAVQWLNVFQHRPQTVLSRYLEPMEASIEYPQLPPVSVADIVEIRGILVNLMQSGMIERMDAPVDAVIVNCRSASEVEMLITRTDKDGNTVPETVYRVINRQGLLIEHEDSQSPASSGNLPATLVEMETTASGGSASFYPAGY